MGVAERNLCPQNAGSRDTSWSSFSVRCARPWLADEAVNPGVSVRNGYRIVPVNPGQTRILDEVCYPDLRSIPFSVEVVDIFRRSEEVMPVVDEAIAIGAKAIWMQIGVIDEKAAAKARSAGLAVVMDCCPKIEYYRR